MRGLGARHVLLEVEAELHVVLLVLLRGLLVGIEQVVAVNAAAQTAAVGLHGARRVVLEGQISGGLPCTRAWVREAGAVDLALDTGPANTSQLVDGDKVQGAGVVKVVLREDQAHAMGADEIQLVCLRVEREMSLREPLQGPRHHHGALSALHRNGLHMHAPRQLHTWSVLVELVLGHRRARDDDGIGAAARALVGLRVQAHGGSTQAHAEPDLRGAGDRDGSLGGRLAHLDRDADDLARREADAVHLRRGALATGVRAPVLVPHSIHDATRMRLDDTSRRQALVRNDLRVVGRALHDGRHGGEALRRILHEVMARALAERRMRLPPLLLDARRARALQDAAVARVRRRGRRTRQDVGLEARATVVAVLRVDLHRHDVELVRRVDELGVAFRVAVVAQPHLAAVALGEELAHRDVLLRKNRVLRRLGLPVPIRSCKYADDDRIVVAGAAAVQIRDCGPCGQPSHPPTSSSTWCCACPRGRPCSGGCRRR
mmetsp:Transcript_93093/g.300924  ORF Transcript_93093/g.300924 Transcript_93093/m.300924 type:complete len:489 (-) Transcript_93093:397-1863(-)